MIIENIIEKIKDKKSSGVVMLQKESGKDDLPYL
jgi:hypothetical protein